MKPTDTALAEFYELTRTTIYNYKKGNIGKKRLYEAMVNFYTKEQRLTTLKEYLRIDNIVIVAIADEENKVLGFTVADRNLERLTSEMFESAYLAMEWAKNNDKSLMDDSSRTEKQA